MRCFWRAVLCVMMSFGSIQSLAAQEMSFFTIGTGGTKFTYYPVGGIIASAISKPPGSRDCETGGSCGVEGLLSFAVSSLGSVDNVIAIASGLRNSGFVQSDVAHWAYTGSGNLSDKAPIQSLRTISALFDEQIHIVVRGDSTIRSVADLRGKRVSVDEPGSGTYVEAMLVLEAHGLSLDDIRVETLKGLAATEAIRNNHVDAIFVVAGYPTKALVDLAQAADIRLLPIDGGAAERLSNEAGFFTKSVIPEGTYSGVESVPTLAIGAQWLTSASEPEALIYAITRALWNERSRQLLDEGHARARGVTLETALDGLVVPLHPGAARFYREQGMLK